MAESNVFQYGGKNVSRHVDNKKGLNYLNWAFVVDTLKRTDPSFNYTAKQFPEINLRTGKMTGRKVNYCEGVNGEGSYVTVTVNFNGQSYTESLPCYKYFNETYLGQDGKKHIVVKINKYNHKKHYPKVMKAVPRPNLMLVNKTIKRAMVKAVAQMTGLGLSLYINGTTQGDGQNSNDTTSTAPSNSASGSNNSNYHYQRLHQNESSQNSFKPSKKQIGYIKGLLKQTKYDGTSAYEYLFNYRDDLGEALNSTQASRAIKYLSGLKKKQQIDKKNKSKSKTKHESKTKPKKANKNKNTKSSQKSSEKQAEKIGSTGKVKQGSLLGTK